MIRLRTDQRHVVDQASVVFEQDSGDFTQGLVGILDLVFDQNHSCLGRIVNGTRLVHIGDRCQTDLEALLGLLELPAERGFLGLGKAD
jgi:hypothetical protein